MDRAARRQYAASPLNGGRNALTRIAWITRPSQLPRAFGSCARPILVASARNVRERATEAMVVQVVMSPRPNAKTQPAKLSALAAWAEDDAWESSKGTRGRNFVAGV